MYLSFSLSFLLAAFLSPFFIQFVKKMQFGQSIRAEGPQSHMHKAGTPTLGGVIFLVPLFILSLFYLDFSYQTVFLLVLTFGYATIGFLDDFIKVMLKRNLGLTAKEKMIFQIIIGGISYLILIFNQHDTSISIPFTEYSFDLGWFYFLFFIFLVVGTTNATNLTDGLDGLLTSTSIIAFSCFAYISYVNHEHHTFVFSLLLVGSLIGFLLFNKNPAKVFMGDTGSLAIGGALVGVAILTKSEILLALIGGIFVLETLSVIIQVLVFKLTKKRVFKMSPIHHHFELSGWSEKKVVSVFSGITLVLCALSIFAL